MSSIAKLYGLKLFQGKITELQIPEIYRDEAIVYSSQLKEDKHA